VTDLHLLLKTRPTKSVGSDSRVNFSSPLSILGDY
jgi:hypothetical protein